MHGYLFAVCTFLGKDAVGKMFNYKENYNKWLEDNFFDEETREELSNITDEKEIVICYLII